MIGADEKALVPAPAGFLAHRQRRNHVPAGAAARHQEGALDRSISTRFHRHALEFLVEIAPRGARTRACGVDTRVDAWRHPTLATALLLCIATPPILRRARRFCRSPSPGGASHNSPVSEHWERHERQASPGTGRKRWRRELLSPRSGAGKFAMQTDRKSTRLNSSHRCISYAV